jgi:hypothetical protein
MARVLIPWRDGCPHRERALEFVLRHHGNVTLATEGGEPWSKARAVRAALAQSDADAVVVADADVWCGGIDKAVMAVACGVATWAVPHRKVFRLSQRGTEELLAGGVGTRWLVQRPYVGLPGGGVVVAHRDTLLDVPPDPRFEGWGQEDESWGIALEQLCGRPWRGTADLVHLWHPYPDRMSRRWGSAANRKLYIRYASARRSSRAMRELVKETEE